MAERVKYIDTFACFDFSSPGQSDRSRFHCCEKLCVPWRSCCQNRRTIRENYVETSTPCSTNGLLTETIKEYTVSGIDRRRTGNKRKASACVNYDAQDSSHEI